MEKLIESANPLLSLAGALFLLGACFDMIFTTEFKSKLRQLIISSANAGRLSKGFLSTYSGIFVAEILSFHRPLAFVGKSIAPSLFFFLLASYVEARNQPEFAGRLQLDFFTGLLLLAPPILAVIAFQLLFDVLSAYISVLYFDIIAQTRKLRVVILVLLSDLFVTSLFWTICFALTLAVHVKIADLYTRETDVALKFVELDDKIWAEDSLYNRNGTLRTDDRKTMAVALFIRARETFLTVRADYIPIITNMRGDEVLASQLFTLVEATSVAKQTSQVSNDNGNFHAKVVVQNLIGFQEFVSLIRYGLNALNTLQIMYNAASDYPRYEYLTTEKIYGDIVDEESGQNWVVGSDVFVFCDKRLIRLKSDAADNFDFGKCAKYAIGPTGAGRYVAETAGINFPQNYQISYKAFFGLLWR